MGLHGTGYIRSRGSTISSHAAGAAAFCVAQQPGSAAKSVHNRSSCSTTSALSLLGLQPAVWRSSQRPWLIPAR
jgi:hypothetical protein